MDEQDFADQATRDDHRFHQVAESIASDVAYDPKAGTRFASPAVSSNPYYVDTPEAQGTARTKGTYGVTGRDAEDAAKLASFQRRNLQPLQFEAASGTRNRVTGDKHMEFGSHPGKTTGL